MHTPSAIAHDLPDLLTRLQSHIAMMAPHQKTRHAGKLLIEARDEIAKLREPTVRKCINCGKPVGHVIPDGKCNDCFYA